MNMQEPQTYAAKHVNENTRKQSRSGGAFTAISDVFLREHGVVYGCVLTERLEAVHIRAEVAETRDLMRGSKYIQSNLQDVFRAVKEDLDAQRKVLFSGTPCQVAGLKSFLGKEDENLCCVDIVCHGVPSPKVWKANVTWLEKKYGRCVSVDFRDKEKFGWADHVESYRMQRSNGEYKTIHSRVFTTMFYGHTILRPCCHVCPYKSIAHPGDLTLADFWAIDEALPGFNDNKGVSLIFVNHPRGARIFQQCEAELNVQPTQLDKSLRPSMLAPYPAPENRARFWYDFRRIPFRKLACRYGGYGYLNRVKKHLRRGIRWLKKRMKHSS